MIGTVIKAKKKDILQLMLATFPEYVGRKFKIVVCSETILSELNWDGGTRSQYRSCTIEGVRLGEADKYNSRAPWDNPAEGAKVMVPESGVIVKHSIFCGYDAGLTFYVNPENVRKLISN